MSRYWLTPNIDDWDAFKEEVKAICALYREAEALYQQGVNLVCVDEMTGIQALERKYKTKPTKQGLVERREFEYIRHGTTCLIANWQVAQGKVVAHTLSPTRDEQDFAAHIRKTIATAPDAQWIFVSDQLNTHMSETLVRLTAELCDIKDDLGKKGKTGILGSMPSRKEFLEDQQHRIRFVYSPKHCSWMNQIEIWFSILVRRLLKRESFKSVDELNKRINEFIHYYNQTMSKPFRWTYQGTTLKAA